MATMRASLRDILEWVMAAVDAATHADDSARTSTYKRLDRLDVREHLGVYVWSPSSTNPESIDGAADEWITDTVACALSVNVPRSPGQVEMLLRVGDHEETLRAAICSHADLLPHQPVWTGTTRELSPDRAWLTSTLTFRLRRFERVRSL